MTSRRIIPRMVLSEQIIPQENRGYSLVRLNRRFIPNRFQRRTVDDFASIPLPLLPVDDDDEYDLVIFNDEEYRERRRYPPALVPQDTDYYRIIIRPANSTNPEFYHILPQGEEMQYQERIIENVERRLRRMLNGDPEEQDFVYNIPRDTYENNNKSEKYQQVNNIIIDRENINDENNKFLLRGTNDEVYKNRYITPESNSRPMSPLNLPEQIQNRDNLQTHELKEESEPRSVRSPRNLRNRRIHNNIIDRGNINDNEKSNNLSERNRSHNRSRRMQNIGDRQKYEQQEEREPSIRSPVMPRIPRRRFSRYRYNKITDFYDDNSRFKTRF